jgi:hypothetical protein
LTAPRRFSASGTKLSPIISISADHKTLTVRGVAIDVISHIGACVRLFTGYENMPFADTGRKRQRAVMKRYATIEGPLIRDACMIANQAFKFPHGQTRDDAIWRTACCDMTPAGERTTDASSSGYKFFQHFLDIVDDRGNIDTTKLDTNGAANLGRDGAAWLHSAVLYTTGRRFCATKNRYLGLVPQGTVAGDVVAILFGGDVPFILRADGNGYYQLIGEGYIHGIMDGEVTAMLDVDGLKQDFNIR